MTVRSPLRSAATFASAYALLALAACTSARTETDDAPTYRQAVGELLRAKCARCHAGSAPPAGWRADTFHAAVGCVSSGRSVLDGPLAAALARPDHAELVTATERSTLERWAAAGGPSVRSGTHDRAFSDPRSPASHGNFLRERGYRPMLSAADDDACGKCHDGVVAKPSGFAFAAPGATDCTTCHAEPGGTLGCGTCHGANGPRDRCFHPDADRAHPAHVSASVARSAGLPCSTCHPEPVIGDIGSPGGTHANGHLEVWFDYVVAGREAVFDPASKTCNGTCHARGGNRTSPSWTEAAGKALACADCHQSPPANHYRGPCNTCHQETNATGTELTAPRLHVNGRADVGDGSGRCGACHGEGDDPWPKSSAHPAHRAPALAKGVACETCHEIPGPNEQHPIGRERAAVRLLSLSRSGGRRASFDPGTQRCSDTYCHDGAGAAVPAPRWNEGAAARACGACHSTPPPAPHPSSTTCEACHPITSSATHLDGLITR